MKITFTAIMFFLFQLLVQAQFFQIDKSALQIDSLKKVLPLLRDSARVDCLNELARSYMEEWQLNFWDSAKAAIEKAYNEAASINYIKGLGDACLRYGIFYDCCFWDNSLMIKYFQEAVYLYKKIGDDNGLGIASMFWAQHLVQNVSPDKGIKAYEELALHYRKAGNWVMLTELNDKLGEAFGKKGDDEKYFEYIKQGLKEKKRIGDNRGIVLSFFRLAKIYHSIGDFETAIDYYRQSIVQANSQSIPWNINKEIGQSFLWGKQYDSAIYYFQKDLHNSPSNGEGFLGLGQLFTLKKEYAKALDYLQNAVIKFKSLNNDGGVMWGLVFMGRSYVGLNQYTKALQCARQSLAIAKRWNSRDIMAEVYGINWNVYEALQQKDSAYFYYLKFAPLQDSLYGAFDRRQNFQKLAMYKAEAKEEQQQARIDLLNKDNQIKQQQLQEEALLKKILAGSLIILFLLGIILFRNVALKRNNEKHLRVLAENELQIQKLESGKAKAEFQQQATELEMQALRTQMNPHFIFNCLSSINRFILKNEAEAASDYLTKFSRLIRMVLTNSKKTFITLEDELDMLRLYIDMERLRFKNNFDYSISFKNEIEPENIFVPPLLFQPFAENAIWHGLMHKEGPGHLEIALSAEKKVLTCIIVDDGVGREKAAVFENRSAKKQKSMGLQITTERLALLNQKIEEKSFFMIEDITDETGNAAGTRVILKMYCRDMAETFV